MGRLTVKLGDWEIDNPIIPASGTFGFGYEFAQYYNLDKLGSISLKGTTKEPRFGNPTPRIAECEAGLINAIGLQNPGVHKVIEEELTKLRQVFHKKAIANISGFRWRITPIPPPSLTKKRISPFWKSISAALTCATAAWLSAQTQRPPPRCAGR